MKKICFVTTVAVTLEMFVVSVAEYLHNSGEFEVSFICKEDDEFAQKLPPYIHFIPVTMSRGVNLQGIKAIRQLTEIFKKEKFDIVQYSTPNASLYASIAAKRAKIPVRIYAQWGMRYVGFSGIVRTIFKMLEKVVCINSTYVRAVSPKNKEFSVKEKLYKSDKAVVLGRGGTIGIDLDEYPLNKKAEWRKTIREKYGISEGFVFGFTGRLSRDKGGNELLSAFRGLLDKNSNIALLVVGQDESGNDMDCELKKWAQSSEKVVFTGSIKKKDMPMYYSAMDALVHPTYREGFGMVIQEAAAMEVAVLTTDIPGASEVLENGKSCILCKPRDIDSLKACMNRLLETKLNQELSVSARKFVCDNYKRSDMIKRQYEDYKRLLED